MVQMNRDRLLQHAQTGLCPRRLDNVYGEDFPAWQVLVYT